MRIKLDPGSRVPLSAQLRDRLAARIVRGRLGPGERLPPIRDLADEMGLAPNTVARAYRELEASGLVVTRGRHGTFVTQRLRETPRGADALLGSAAEAYVRRARQLGAGSSDTLDAVRRVLER